MPAPDRLVLDTNNIVSLILTNDLLFFAELKLLHETDVFTCPEQIKELRQTLSYKKIAKRLSQPAEEYIEFISRYSVLTPIDQRFDRAPDIKDNYLFDLAYTAKSFYIVSGDRDVLGLKQVNKIRVISIAELRRMINRGK